MFGKSAHTVGIVAGVIVITLLLFVGIGQAAPAPGDSRLSATPQPRYFPLIGRDMRFGQPTPTSTPITPSEGLPAAKFSTDDFEGPSNCQNCHSNMKDTAGTDVTVATHWRSTMMANAANDPLWLAKVRSEIIRNPDAAEVLEQVCSRCHMPMAYTQAEVLGQPQAIFGDGFLDPGNPLHEAAMDGVSCTLCHQIQPDGLGTPDSFSGHFVIDTGTEPPDRILFGPYPDPDPTGTTIMRSGSGYTPQQGPQMTGSSLCASCHTLFTPYSDPEGGVGMFPEQTPYLEWLNSDFGDGMGQDQQCQACHMPQAEGGVALFPGWPERQPFFQHYFVGGNVFMLKVLQAHVDELGLRASTALFGDTIQRTLDQLQKRTALLSVDDADLTGDALTLKLGIRTQAGHKVPTGYPGRRLWLHVAVHDFVGRTVFDSGMPLSSGAIQGNDADFKADAYEPHYDLITDPGQVQIYETIMHDGEGQVTYTLLDATGYTKDNRLLPQGFDKEGAVEAIAVAGAAAEDPTFVGGGDQITYAIDTGHYEPPFTVEVELLYQSLSYRFVRDLRQDQAPEIERFGRYFDEADKMPVVLATEAFRVPEEP